MICKVEKQRWPPSRTPCFISENELFFFNLPPLLKMSKPDSFKHLKMGVAWLFLIALVYLFVSATAGLFPFNNMVRKKVQPHPGRPDMKLAEDGSPPPPPLNPGEHVAVLVGMEACPFCVEAVKTFGSSIKSRKLYYLSLGKAKVDEWFVNMPGVAQLVTDDMKKNENRIPYFARIERSDAGEYTIGKTVVGYNPDQIRAIL